MISQFIKHNFRHFNSATLVDAAEAWQKHSASGRKMLVAIGGAMSTAEIGVSLAEMIRQDKVHAISCSANNLEEDIFNLVAHNEYKRIPNYRDLTPQDERNLLDNHFNRVTDTCIPEEEAIRKIQKHMFEIWRKASQKMIKFVDSDATSDLPATLVQKLTGRKMIAASDNNSALPYEFFYHLIGSKVLEKYYQIDPQDSWVLAAYEKDIPIFTPGWEDSTLGNIFTSYCLKGELHPLTVQSGIFQMMRLTQWYQNHIVNKVGPGFFQIGGGIAGDFPICVVPMLQQDMKIDVPFWSYFCQITDTNESYGSYSGAAPAEKITWGKLDVDTPKFAINSDATIVAPLIFAYVLGQ